MEAEPRAIYRFDRFMLDLDRGLLLGDDSAEWNWFDTGPLC
jgi:hypothetical protein